MEDNYMQKMKSYMMVGISIFSILLGTMQLGTTVDADAAWSAWVDTKPANESQYDIESRTVYRYRDKSTTTSTDSTLSGWTQYDSVTTWGDWSEWQDETVTSSAIKEVKTRDVYQYRDKSTTTSTSSSLSGWTQYDSVTTWGDWSAWQDTAVTATTTRKVETKQVQTAAGYTQWRYWRWRSDNCSKGIWWHFCDACGSSSYGGTWYQQITPWQNTPITNLADGNYCNHGYNYNNAGQKSYIYTDGTKYYHEQTRYIQPTYKTQYRYKNSTTTYYFYKWSAWSSWSTTQPSTASNREINNKTQYSYKDATITYCFYQWSDWSSWSTAQPVSDVNREIEQKVQYRYKAKQSNNSSSSTTDVNNTTETTAPSVTVPSQVTNGSEVTVSNNQYVVSDVDKATVTYNSTMDKNKVTVTVPDVVKINGKDYKVTRVADGVFQNNKKIKKLKIGNNVTFIGKNAFKGCTSLKSVTIGKNVKKIGNSAFEGCEKLTKITIPKKVTSIGSKAFYKCKKLKTVTVAASDLNKVGKKAFAKIAKKPALQFKKSVPKNKRDKYLKLLKR